MTTAANPPQGLKVDLAYYSGHERLLRQGVYAALGTPAKVAAFQARGEIPLSDFLNYFLIHRAKNPIFATYGDRNKVLNKAVDMLEYVMTTTGTVNCQDGSDDLQKWVGESLSLAVIGGMFGLTAADWATIPVEPFSAFDFERPMTGITLGGGVIQVEAKGTFVDDNTRGQNNVHQQAAKIATKKKNIAAMGPSYPYPAAARYGVIASIDPNHTAKCFLLDPSGDQLDGDPRRHKIANRLEHLALILSILAPSAKIPGALVKRASAWRQAGTPEPSGTLETSGGYAFSVDNYVENFLATGKLWIKDLDIVGQLYQGDAQKPLFVGLRADVVRKAIKQDPDAILQLSFEPSAEMVDLTSTPIFVGLQGKEADVRRHHMLLHTASSGVVIGLPAQA